MVALTAVPVLLPGSIGTGVIATTGAEPSSGSLAAARTRNRRTPGAPGRPAGN